MPLLLVGADARRVLFTSLPNTMRWNTAKTSADSRKLHTLR